MTGPVEGEVPSPVLARNGTVVADPRLGRLPHFDDRSRDFQIRAELNDRRVKSALLPPRERRGRHWIPGPTLDQQREGQCVSEACHDARNGSPDRQKPAIVKFEERRDFYHVVQHRDPWSGCYLGAACPIDPQPGAGYGGTSVLAGGMEGIDRGYWREVRWLGAGSGRLEDDLIDTLRTVGGVIFGIPWREGMYVTSPSGLLEVTGGEVGGHAIHGFEWAPRQEMPKHWRGTRPGVWLHNSWGPTYGVRRRGVTGCAFVQLDDLLGLLDNRQGEGMVPLL